MDSPSPCLGYLSDFCFAYIRTSLHRITAKYVVCSSRVSGETGGEKCQGCCVWLGCMLACIMQNMNALKCYKHFANYLGWCEAGIKQIQFRNCVFECCKYSLWIAVAITFWIILFHLIDFGYIFYMKVLEKIINCNVLDFSSISVNEQCNFKLIQLSVLNYNIRSDTSWKFLLKNLNIVEENVTNYFLYITLIYNNLSLTLVGVISTIFF